MTKILCVSDIHDEESKFAQMADWAKGHDAIITAGDDLGKYINDASEENLLLGALVKKHGQTHHVTPQTRQELEQLLQSAEELPPEQQKAVLGGFLQKHPEVIKGEHIKKDFLAHYAQRAQKINAFYKKAGIPAYGTAGNHDPLPALGQMNAVKYLLGETAELKGLSIAGLPATGEWVPGPMQFCPEYYPHLMQYHPEQVSGLAKKLIEQPKIDVFITHKAYKQELQEWDEYYQEGQPMHEFGVDAGAVAVDKKFKPALNVFGHYHMERAKVKRSEDGMQWFLYVGPNAAVHVTFNGKKPFEFQGKYYN